MHHKNRPLKLLALVVVALVIGANHSSALPKKDDREPGCLPGSRSRIEGVTFKGVKEGERVLVNTVLGIDVKATVQQTLPDCETTQTKVPATFQVTPPNGSRATIARGPSNATTLQPDVVGDYLVTVVSCGTACGNGFPSAVPAVVSFRLSAVSQLAPAPKTDPVVPKEPHTDPLAIADKDTKCSGGGGVVDPQWVPVNPWNGPQDYRLLQGRSRRLA
jgi:hypothetical protein